MHTLLARRLAAGTQLDALALRHAMEDMWRDALVNRRWQRVALKLSEADCERLVRYAGRRGLTGADWHWLDRAAATEGWALETQGHVVSTSKPAFDRHAPAFARVARAARGSTQTPAAGRRGRITCAAARTSSPRGA